MTFNEIIEDIYRRSYRVYAGMALRTLRPMGRRATGMVEEVVQEAFLEILRKGQPKDFFHEETVNQTPRRRSSGSLSDGDWPRFEEIDYSYARGRVEETHAVRQWTDERLSKYIGGILRYVALDAMKKVKSAENQASLQRVLEETSKTQPDGLKDLEHKDIISRAWDSLDKEALQLLVDRYENGLKIEELAEKYGCSNATIERHLGRAINAFRRAVHVSRKVKRQ